MLSRHVMSRDVTSRDINFKQSVMRIIDLTHLARSLEAYRSWLNFIQNTHVGLRQSPNDHDRDQVGSIKPWRISEYFFNVKRRLVPRIYEASPIKTSNNSTSGIQQPNKFFGHYYSQDPNKTDNLHIQETILHRQHYPIFLGPPTPTQARCHKVSK